MQFAESISPDIVRARALAKVNLALSVGPPRDSDGLHPISSWFAPVDLADELTVTRLEPDRFSRYAIVWHDDAPKTSPIDWSITSDLAVRAHRALEEHVMQQLPVQLKLEKRIPVGGGFGGGSSDAAAMLHAVRSLYELQVDDEDLARIALDLGSDVPFFLRAGSAVVGGVGDEIEPMPDVEGDLVLIFPGCACDTGAVYRAFDDQAGAALREGDVLDLARGASPDPRALFNDLAEPARDMHEALDEAIGRVELIAEMPVHVTGSGSGLFILCPGGEKQSSELACAITSGAGGCVAISARFA